MALFEEDIQKQLQQILSQMQNRVQLVLFTQEIECPFCKEAHQFAEEFTSLDDRLGLTVYKLVEDKAMADKYQVDKVPALLLLDADGQDMRIRFYGIPAGYEINSFLFSILAASGKREEIPPEIRQRIKQIDKDVVLTTFVSMTCPNCPDAVTAANFLAFENPKIRSEMVESGMFTHLAIRHNVSSVPKTILNGSTEWVGALPIPMILDMIDKLEK